MKNGWKRLTSLWLAAALSLSLAAPAWAVEPAAEAEAGAGEDARPFSVTVGDYVPDMAGSENIQAGGIYTLIALPADIAMDGGAVKPLTPDALLAAAGQALYIGSAVASENGYVAFRDVRLRTADAVVYYVTGPGLETPLYEATNDYTSIVGAVLTDTLDHSATIALVDGETGYAYANTAEADEGGDFFFEHVAPGTYSLRVTKPGYLPTTRTAVEVPDRGEMYLPDFDISSAAGGLFRVGDVTGDGVRDMEDLAAMLLCFERPDAVPVGFTADLNGDGAVDKLDSDLLLTAAAKPDVPDIATGTAENVTGARLTVKDSNAAATAAQRYLSIGAETAATVSAAAFSLTFPLDAVQPLNAAGGLISPVDGSSVASCLVPASGVEVKLARWQVRGGYATLSFALTCGAPKAAGELARFYYCPAEGSTAGFYDGVFTLDHAAGLVGRNTVVTLCDLAYPGRDNAQIDRLVIDQSDAALTIPAAGRTAVLALSATGYAGQTAYPDLTGLVWTVADESGQTPEWAGVEQGLLTVTADAVPGTLSVTAARGDVVSEPLSVTLENEAAVPTTLVVEPVQGPATLTVASGEQGRLAFAATVYDQYGKEMELDQGVTWSLSGHPDGVSVDDAGVLTADCTALAARDGGYRFTLHAQVLGLSQGVQVTLLVEAQLAQLVIAGPDSAIIPDRESAATVLEYTVTGLDRQGDPMDLSADDVSVFSVAPADQGVEASKGLDGSYTVTVSPTAQAGEYTITAAQGDVEGTYTLTLTQAEDYVAVRAYLDAQDGGQYTLQAGTGLSAALEAVLLDADGDLALDQPEAWTWTLSPQLEGFDLIPGEGGAAELTVDKTVAPGRYTLAVTAADEESGLSVTLPILLEIQSVLARLELAAPESLAIPETGTVECALTVNGWDGQGAAMSNLEDLIWSVTGQDDEPVQGVEVQAETRRLVVSSSAVPGQITLRVTSPEGDVEATADVTLTPAGTSTELLVLYQTVVLDGKTEAELAARHTETFTMKEGQTLRVSYTAMLVDQTVGKAMPVPADQVKWLGAGNSFTVDANAESGVYSRKVTAVYQGQSASAEVQATLYPNITGLLLDFGDGADGQPPYTMMVPSRGSKLYSATVLAQFTRAGVTQTAPIASLGLTDYNVEMATALTGLYSEFDRETGVLTFIVDPAAIQNPTSAPTDGTRDIRYILIFLDYFPGETLQSDSLALYLQPEVAAPASAMLRRGVGTGISFAFGTPLPGEKTTVAAGTRSNCYALELLDQYGRPISGTVTWNLTGPADVVSPSGGKISIVDPGAAIQSAYPGYASIRRLRVAPDCPEGDYQLTLTAQCGGMTCALPIDLSVKSMATAEDLTMTLFGEGQVVIPMYYAQYNSTTVNTRQNTTEYTAILEAAAGGELDLTDGYSLTWTVTDPEGQTPAGVTITPVAGGPSATVSVSNSAQPTGVADATKHTVTATLWDPQGQMFTQASARLELNRSASVPTLMTLRKSGETTSVTSASFSMAASSTDVLTQDYTFHLLDQYNELASLKDRRQVTWSLANDKNSGVTLQTLTDADGVPYAHIQVENPGYSVNKTVTLTAAITIVEEKASSGRQTIYYSLPIKVTIGSSSGGGGGGGGGGLGGGGEEDTSTSGVPASIAINGNTSVSTSVGKATTATYSATLRDASGKTCSSSYTRSVTWSSTISPAGSGITFNNATHVLSVPATAKAGTYTVTITARYTPRSLSATRTVTVTVGASSGTPAKLSIGGTTSISATQGTAATYTYTANLTDAAGAACPAAEVNKVTWSASGLTSNITFNTTTHTLTIPATVPAGTYSVTLTAKYAATNLSASATVTITVAAKQADAVGATIVPTMTATGTAGSVTLNATQEKAITDSSATGATITIAPTGPTNLTSATVTLTAATAKTMAGRSQSLKVRTTLGTVVLPAQSLSALAGQGGSNVSVTVSSDHGVIKVTFTCGYESAQLPGSIALSVPTSGNVALRTVDGGKSVMKKAVVKNGSILAYVTGSIQLEMETRQPTFSDTQSHWARDAISFTAARELFTGVTPTTFAPDTPMTRAMLVTVLHRLEDTPAAAVSNFADVPAEQWYTDAVGWASAKGIVQGTGTGFAPDGNISREQLATIIYRYVGSLGLSTGQQDDLSAFSDRGQVNSWALEGMRWAVGAGLITGKPGGLLDPGGAASRAEVSTILQRLISNILVPTV